MVSHPETGSDSTIGSDRDSGHDRYDTWLPMCQVSSPQVPHGKYFHAKCRHMIRPFASKYVKFRLSQNSMKFDYVPRFREMNSTVWSASSS